MTPILRSLFLLLAWTTLSRNMAWGERPFNPSTTAAVAPCANPGRDGSPTALNGTVNTYFAGTGTANANSTSLPVAASAGANTAIAAGDLLLVIQMQGADINSDNANTYGAGSTSGSGYLNNTAFTAGNYEYVVANSALATGTAGTITTTTALVNSYSTAAATTTTGRRSFQVVRIPQYANVTLGGGQLTALAWDGNRGGILAIDVAGTLTLNGQTLSAAGLGFRGGGGKVYTGAAGLAATDYRTSNTKAANGSKGEGIAGTPRYTLASPSATITASVVDNQTNTAAFGSTPVSDGYPNGDNGRGAPGNAGGGATDNFPGTGTNTVSGNGLNSGGAGGANGGAGGGGGWPRINPNTNAIDKTNTALGGTTFAQAASSRLVMGGGGGAGSNNDGNGSTGLYSSGAVGGGIIIVRAGSLSGTGTADASGAGGYVLSSTAGNMDAAGGGGAGGTILITAKTTTSLALTTRATGGQGGSTNNTNDVAHGCGGGGSGGVVLTNVTVTANVAGGAAGTVTSKDAANSGTTYGATAGAAGTSTTNISTPINNSVAGADCVADVAATLSTAQTSVLAGATITYTAVVLNNGPATATSVVPTIQLSAGLMASAFTLPAGASYNPTTGVLTLPTTASLGVGTANQLTYTITLTAPNFTTTIPGTIASTASSVDVTTGNNNGTAANAQVQTVVTLPSNGCAGTPYGSTASSGLYAEYYAGYFNDDLTYFANHTAGLTRTDGNVNFASDDSWGNIVPPATAPINNPQTYSARYRGSLSISTGGSYTLTLRSDDASYLWLDGAALVASPTAASATINSSGQHSAVNTTATVTLAPGSHNLLIFYGQNGGDNVLTLSYSGPDTNNSTVIVPNSVLCATQAPLADLATTLSGPTTAAAGQTVYYLASTTNNGPSAAPSTITTITLPGKPASVVTTGTYDATKGIVTFNNGTLASGATIVNSVSFVATATATGQSASSAASIDDAVPNNSNGSMANANVTTTVSPTGAAGTAANCATAGKDGPATALAATPNAYYPSTAAQTLTGGTSTSITVGAARGAATSIAPGDLLLVIQMQGADINTTNTDTYGDGVAGGSANGSSVTTNFTAGTYEYVTVATNSATVSASAGGTITLATALKNSYSNAVATSTTGQRTFQVIRVPQYTNVTLASNISPTAWNGSTGGIVALDVDGQLNLAGFTIDASGLGFRGGAGRQLGGDKSSPSTTAGTDYRSSAGLNTGGTKGEGIVGTPRYVNDPAYAAANSVLLDTRTATTGYPTLLPASLADGYPSGDNGRGAPGNAGGGGTDANPSANDQNSGGGGGANGGRGGRGGNSWTSNSAVGGEPGAAFPAASSSRLILGGGGGAGVNNDGTGTPGTGFASSGAAGGGAVLVRTGTLTGTGSILANGANANNSVNNDGSGGGGAGGSILVTVTNSQATTASLTLTATGGTGGTNAGGGVSHGPGGGGGGGVIFTNSTVVATATANGAANGTTVPGTLAYGAEAGTVGLGNAAISNSIANSTAGANCIADVATTITGPTNANAGSTVSLNVTFSNIGAQSAAGVSRTVTLPAGVLNINATDGNGTVTLNPTTGVSTVTYPATSLASGASNTYTLTYTAPGSGPVAANSAISTATNEGGLTANNTSSVSTNIGLIADVTTAITGPQTVNPGQPTGTYTVTFTNEGPSTASTVTRTVTLPTGATNIIVNGAAYTPTTANTIDFGSAATLPSGASNAFTFSFTPATTASGTVAVTSNVSTTISEGSNAAPDASTINATVVPVANVATTIAATTTTVAAGTLASASTPPKFTVSFTNTNGPSTAAGVVAAVQLPTGLTNVKSTNNTNGVYNSATGVLTYPDLTSLTSGGSTTSVITFDAPATGPVVASSSISTTTSEAGQTSDNKAAATMAITPAFDLTTTLTGPSSAVAGDLVTLAVTTTNNGPSAAANAVQTVQLTSGLNNVFVSNGGVYNPATSTQTITVKGVSYSVPAGGVVFPTIASLPTGQTVANSISFTQPNATITPTAQVTPKTTSTATVVGDTYPDNNSANYNAGAGNTLSAVNAQGGTANAYTTIASSVASTTIGSAVTLTVTTGNRGFNQATGVTQLVQLLPGFDVSTIKVNNVAGTLSGTTITFGTGGPTYDTGTGIITFPTLTNGTNGSTSATSVNNTITFTAPATTGSNGQLLATATVRTTNTDPVAADNVSSVAVTLLQSTDLVTNITGPASALAGQSVTYTASFTNNGPMAATGVAETVQLPAGLGASGVTITDADGNSVNGATYNTTTGQVTFSTLTNDANGATQVYKLTFAAPALSFAPSSSVTSTSSDAVAANNNASVATAVTPVIDLATTVAGPATTVVGNPVTYTTTTTNNGPSAAANTMPTLLLASGFTTSTLQVNGTTGTFNSANNTITYTIGAGATATTATYNTTSGLVTFPTVASLANGASVANYVTFVMPNPTGGQTSGVASATATGTDPVSSNNSASVATSIAPTTTATADLTATVTNSATNSTTTVGASVTFTAAYGNIGTSSATSVLPTLQLPAGLTTTTLQSVAGGTGTANGTTITFPNGSSYNTQTGVLTFPTIASQATGTTGNVSYAVQVLAPANGPLVATAATTSSTSEPNTTAAQSNNAFSTSVTITPSFNEVTSISGPASAVPGTSQTYTVTTTNNGPSVTSNPTTQTVTVPANQTPTNITNGGVYSSSANTITWTVAAGQGSGSNGAVANSFTIVQPTSDVTLTASVSVTGESNTGDNTALITTTVANQPPLAYAVVNSLQNPQSNEAGGFANGLPISPLSASDPENSFATNKYTIVAAPDASSQGTLYYNTTGTTYATVANGQTLTDAQAQTLKFKAATGFVGNASFTYQTNDAAGNASPVVNYTIPVETDVDAVAYTLTPTKGGASNPYGSGDIIAYTRDANGAVYNATAARVYMDNGTLQTGASNGIVSATTTGTLITSSRSNVATLADLGLAVDNTGRLYVDKPGTSTNPNLRSGNYSVSITTTDGNGGLTTQTVSFVVPGSPLPVVLTAFTATAVGNRDAQLSWTTASEENSAYFDLERSFDGKAFTKVGQVAAQGNSSSATTYAFTDKAVASLTAGLVYYRLKQVDRDATATYSPVRTISFTKAASLTLSLYPNPAQYATSLDLSQLPSAASYQVQLLDATGRLVRSATVAGGQVQPLNLTELATGTYHVLVTGTLADGSALRQTLRLTKE